MAGLRFKASRVAALRAALGGWTARRDGQPLDDCPYDAGGSTVEAFLAQYWKRGWERGPQQAVPPEDPTTAG